MKRMLFVIALLLFCSAIATAQNSGNADADFHALAQLSFDNGPEFYGITHVTRIGNGAHETWCLALTTKSDSSWLPEPDLSLAIYVQIPWEFDKRGNVTLGIPKWGNLYLMPENGGSDPQWLMFARFLGATFGTGPTGHALTLAWYHVESVNQCKLYLWK